MAVYKREVFAVTVLIALLVITLPVAARGRQDEPRVEPDSVEITIWSWREKGVVLPAAFEAENPNIKVRWEVVPSEVFPERVAMAALSGTLPDGFAVTEGYLIPEFVRNGWLEPLDEYVKDWGDEIWSDFYPGSLDGFIIDEQLYAVPMFSYNLLLHYRVDLFEEAGIPHPPRTWAEVLAAANILNDPPNRWGFVTVGGGVPHHLFNEFIAAFGGYGGTVTEWGPLINTDIGIQFLRNYQDGIHKHRIMSPETTGIGIPEARSMFLNGQAAIAIVAEQLNFRLAEVGLNWGEHVGLVHMPLHDRSVRPSNHNIALPWAIFSTSEHKEETFKFLEWYMKPENLYHVTHDYMVANRISVGDVRDYRDLRPWFDHLEGPLSTQRPVSVYTLFEYAEEFAPIYTRVLENRLTPERAAEQLDAIADRLRRDFLSR